MLVTPRECNQVGRNSCTNAITSIAVDSANSSALSTLELPARDRRGRWRRRRRRRRLCGDGLPSRRRDGAHGHLDHTAGVANSIPELRVGGAEKVQLADFAAPNLAQPVHIAELVAVEVDL